MKQRNSVSYDERNVKSQFDMYRMARKFIRNYICQIGLSNYMIRSWQILCT